MNKLYIGFLLILVSFGAKAQVSSSPYSMYGIGEVNSPGFVSNRAMGSTGIALSSAYSINNINPAANHSFDSTSYVVDIGYNTKLSNYNDNGNTQRKTISNFNYIAVGFRILPWIGTSLGITPYSTMGNSLTTYKSVEGSTEKYKIKLEGSGTVNQIFWSNTFSLTKNFHLGLNVSYYFGTLTQSQNFTITDISTTPVINDEMVVSSFNATYGFQYSHRLNSRTTATLGGTFGFKTPCSTTKKTTYLLDSDTLTSESNNSSDYYIPLSYGIGFGLNYDDRLQIAADYSTIKWSSIQSNLDQLTYVDNQSFNLGAEFKPSNSFRASYFEQLKYRIGGHYTIENIAIDQKKISNIGISGGIEFPVRHRFLINVAYEYGRRGGDKTYIINENYNRITIGLSFVDYLTRKMKYD